MEDRKKIQEDNDVFIVAAEVKRLEINLCDIQQRETGTLAGRQQDEESGNTFTQKVVRLHVLFLHQKIVCE